MEIRKAKMTLVIIAILIFIVSLTQPAFSTGSNHPDSSFIFLFGWLGAFSFDANSVWLANPLVIASWVLLFKNVRGALITSVTASIISSLFLIAKSVAADESGCPHHIVARESGYWLWLISILVTFIGTLIIYIKQISQNNNMHINNL